MPFSKRQIFILIGVGVVVLFLIGAIMLGGRQLPGAGTTLTVWGVLDDGPVYTEIFERLRRETGISATYVKKDVATFERELINALAAGRGPDVFMINNSWLGRHLDKIAPAPAGVVALDQVRRLYPEIVSADFIYNGQVWALPLFIDTLALFYNRDLLDQAGIALAPETWEEVVAIAPRLTRVSPGGVIQQSAISLGTANNVSRASDILAMLMMQYGSPIVDRARFMAVLNSATDFAPRSAGQSALEFYLQFANPASRAYSWSGEQRPSLDAFAEGSVAMKIAYHFQADAIREKGPFLNFGVAPLPQFRGRVARVDYGDYWGFAVSRQSRRQSESWRWISAMTTQDDIAGMYLRSAGRPPVLRSLIQANINDTAFGVFSRQALTARSWFQPDSTEVERIFLEMIESARRGAFSPEVAVRRATDEINRLLAGFRR